jgi:hypothetical protein
MIGIRILRGALGAHWGQVLTYNLSLRCSCHAGMSRPLQIDLDHGIYHVTSRDWERHVLVRDDRDRLH